MDRLSETTKNRHYRAEARQYRKNLSYFSALWRLLVRIRAIVRNGVKIWVQIMCTTFCNEEKLMPQRMRLILCHKTKVSSRPHTNLSVHSNKVLLFRHSRVIVIKDVMPTLMPYRVMVREDSELPEMRTCIIASREREQPLTAFCKCVRQITVFACASGKLTHTQ